MITRIVVILLVFWLVGFLAGVSGALIHLLLLVAGMLVLGKVIEPRPLR